MCSLKMIVRYKLINLLIFHPFACSFFLFLSKWFFTFQNVSKHLILSNWERLPVDYLSIGFTPRVWDYLDEALPCMDWEYSRFLLKFRIFIWRSAWRRMCQLEFEILLVFGSEKVPDALHPGLSENRSRTCQDEMWMNGRISTNRPSWQRRGRQFQIFEDVRAKEEFWEVTASLWMRK